jgi:hypothetical protein
MIERASAMNWMKFRHVFNGKTKMRTFIFAVAAIVAASWATDQAPAADRIPAFDIVRNCTAEVASAGTEKIADCTNDETDAKNELDKSWPQFGASDKQACVKESSIAGDESYVELLTCLEMSSGEFLASRRQIQ